MIDATVVRHQTIFRSASVIGRCFPADAPLAGNSAAAAASDNFFSFDQLSSAQIHIAGGASKTWQNH
jgi:hypothetical protein